MNVARLPYPQTGMSPLGRYCRKRVSRETAEQYRFKIKRKYAILIQRTECPDSIIYSSISDTFSTASALLRHQRLMRWSPLSGANRKYLLSLGFTGFDPHET